MERTLKNDRSFTNIEDVIRHIDKSGRWQYVTLAKTGVIMIGMSLILYSQGLFFVGRMKPECVEYNGLSEGSSYLTKFFNQTTTNATNSQRASSVCALPVDANGTGGEKCVRWKYSSPYYASTMMSEYDLVCDRAYILPTFQSAMFVGQVIGNPLSGVLSDRYGRRITLFVGQVGLLTSALTMGFIQSVWWNIITRVFCGICTTTVWNAIFVLCMEMAVPERRHAVGTYAAISWPLGAALASFMAYFLRQWRQLCWATVLLAAVTGIPIALTLPESPRWLVFHGQIGRAHKILRKIANKSTNAAAAQLPADDSFLRSIYRAHTADAEHQQHSKSSPARQVIHLLAERRLRVRSLMLAISWTIVAFVFFGIMLYGSDALPNANPTLILGAMNTLRNALPLICVMLLGLGFLPLPRHMVYGAVVYAAIYIAAHVLSDLCMAALYIVTGELYPTVLRQTSLGFFSLVARGGSLGSSYAASLLSQVWAPLPAVVFAGASAIGAAAVLVLPHDADDAALPDTISDAHKIDDAILPPAEKLLLSSRRRSSKVRDDDIL